MHFPDHDEHPCRMCGAPWSRHRASDQLCPGRRPDGSVWPGAWENDGSPGTRYQPVDGGSKGE